MYNRVRKTQRTLEQFLKTLGLYFNIVAWLPYKQWLGFVLEGFSIFKASLKYIWYLLENSWPIVMSVQYTLCYSRGSITLGVWRHGYLRPGFAVDFAHMSLVKISYGSVMWCFYPTSPTYRLRNLLRKIRQNNYVKAFQKVQRALQSKDILLSQFSPYFCSFNIFSENSVGASRILRN